MSFTHGVYTKELETSIKPFSTAQAPIFIVGAGMINMGDTTSVNRLELITSHEDAVRVFGGTPNLKGENLWTINQLLDNCLNIFNTLPIVAVNVLDPAKHSREVTLPVKFKDGKGSVGAHGVLLDTITLDIDGGFEASFADDGTLILIIENEDVEQATITYRRLDPKMIENSDVHGGLKEHTAERFGLALVDEVYPQYSMIPSSIIAPKFSENINIKTLIDVKAKAINKKWGTIGIVEVPNTIDFGDVIEWKKENNVLSEDLMLVYGSLKNGNKEYHPSATLAALMQRIDTENGGVPYESPSNKTTNLQAMILKEELETVEKLLDESQANMLNEKGIITWIKQPHGLVPWGNRTSIYPSSTDPKDMWIPVKRMFKYIANTLQINTAADVDRPMVLKRAEHIQKNINIFLSSLVSQGYLHSARVDFNVEDNPIDDLMNGKFKWHIMIGGVVPGETLSFDLEYDPEGILNIFK